VTRIGHHDFDGKVRRGGENGGQFGRDTLCLGQGWDKGKGGLRFYCCGKPILTAEFETTAIREQKILKL